MNFKVSSFLALLALIALTFGLGDAHKHFHSAPQYGGERCVCDCGRPAPILPNTPYHGSAGYAQPRPVSSGYGNAGSYAVAGSYGSGGGQVSGGY